MTHDQDAIVKRDEDEGKVLPVDLDELSVRTSHRWTILGNLRAAAKDEEKDLVARILKNARRREDAIFAALSTITVGFIHVMTGILCSSRRPPTRCARRSIFSHCRPERTPVRQLIKEGPCPDLGSKKDVLDVLQVRQLACSYGWWLGGIDKLDIHRPRRGARRSNA